MSGLTQWAIVGIALVLAVGYAAKVLMPRSWKDGLAVFLRRRGFPQVAETLEQKSGCEACQGRVRPRAVDASASARQKR